MPRVLAGLALAGLCSGRAGAVLPAAPMPTQATAREGAVLLRGDWADDMVPPFRAGSRDRLRGELEAWAWLHTTVRLDARLDLRADRFPSGLRRAGPGDLRLGVLVRPLRGREGASEALALGWLAKLPNAEDEGELGTDETDVTVWGEGRLRRGPWSVGGRAGLAILGHPLLVASQDDVPLTWASAGWGDGQAGLVAEVGGAWRTPRNPARMEARLRGELGCPWLLQTDLGLGLTPAAPRWSAGVALGRDLGGSAGSGRACRSDAGD